MPYADFGWYETSERRLLEEARMRLPSRFLTMSKCIVAANLHVTYFYFVFPVKFSLGARPRFSI